MGRKEAVPHIIVLLRRIPARWANKSKAPAIADETPMGHLCAALEDLNAAEVRCDAVVRADARIRGVLDALGIAREMRCVNCDERYEIRQLDRDGLAFIRLCGHCVEAEKAAARKKPKPKGVAG
jgi:hypothetical protein